jgi:hypothetical protein
VTIEQVAHSASFGHGLSGDLAEHGGKHPPFEPETERSVRYLLGKKLIERRARTVDLGPRKGWGNWPEMEPHGVVTIVTWHLTPAGRDAWMHGRL